jgi:hypothetical protein
VLVLDLLERPTAGRAALLAAALAAAAALHTVAGFAAAVSLAAIAAQRLAGALGGRRPPPWRALALVAFATLAAIAITAPYVLAVAAPRRHPPALALEEASWLGWAVWGALFTFPGLGWLAAWSRRSNAARDLLAAAGALSALGLFLALPDGNQSKFLNLLFVLLAPPAALGLLALAGRAGARGRRLLAGTLVAALLPNLLLIAWGYAGERGRFDEPSHRPASATLEAWRWLRANTAPATVVADREGGSDMQVFAARSALWGGGHLERDWGSPIAAMEARRQAARELGVGGPPSAGTVALLRELGRPVVVVDRHPVGPGASIFGRAPGTDTSRFRRLRTVPQMTLYEYHPAP